MPLPHVREQVDQGPNEDTVQWIGHAPSLHALDSPSAAHITPPCSAATITERERECTPTPHDAEHRLQAFQTLAWQSIGQGCAWHTALSSRVGQILPPYAASRFTLRRRFFTPPPHVLEQASQSPHCDTSQSTGHHFAAQVAVSSRSGHATPPYSASRFTLRERDL